MKLILDINKKSRVSNFMEMLKGLDYVKVVKQIDDAKKSQTISDLAEAFEDVKLHQNGKKKLQTAQELIDELQNNSN
jgi:hypothetical protein